MKVAVIGSRGLRVSDLGNYLPEEVSEIISGGAKGVDTCAKEYALSRGLKLTEFLPEYKKYGRAAPLKRNITVIFLIAYGASYLLSACFRRSPLSFLLGEPAAGRRGAP